MFELNLLGVVRCCRAAIPHLRRSTKSSEIVTVTSINGLTAIGSEPYSAAKAGAGSLTTNGRGISRLGQVPRTQARTAPAGGYLGKGNDEVFVSEQDLAGELVSGCGARGVPVVARPEVGEQKPACTGRCGCGAGFSSG